MKLGKLIIILIFLVNSHILLVEVSPDVPATNEQYLITGKIKERKTITGSPRPPEIISSNKYGGTTRVYAPPMFVQIELKDYKMYRIEDRLVGRIFFSTNVPASNIIVIVNDLLADTKPDEKPCIVFAEPYSLPEDVIQKYNLQGAMILQVKGCSIFKEGPAYDSFLKKYNIKPPAWAETPNSTNIVEQAPAQDIEGQKTNSVTKIQPVTIKK